MSAVRTTATLFANDDHAALASRLRVLLLALEYEAFAHCLCVLLEAIGYKDARPAGRAEWKGYNRPGGGGYDLQARLPGGLSPRRVVAQIKQFDGLNVHQRSVDELRGACLRAGAAEALLVTTSAFSEVVRRSAASLEPAGGLIIKDFIAPVRLIGGEELLALMVRHRVGVRERRWGVKRFLETNRREIIEQRGMSDRRERDNGLEIDEAFFRSLPGPGAAPAPQPGRPAVARWRVSVHIRMGKSESAKSESAKSESAKGKTKGGR